MKSMKASTFDLMGSALAKKKYKNFAMKEHHLSMRAFYVSISKLNSKTMSRTFNVV